MSRKLSTIQKRENLNDVYAMDKPGNGGANHRYEICCTLGESEGFKTECIEIIQFQSGEFACRENACALTHIEEALMWMNRRVEDRIERNVLGTNNK